MSQLVIPAANKFTRNPKSALQPLATLANPNTFTSWTQTRSAVVGGQSDPLAGTNAFKITEDATATSTHLIQQGFGTFQATWPSQLTIFAKGATRSWIRIGDAIGNAGAWFNVTAGTIGTVQAGSKAYISAQANGWFQITLVAPKMPNGTFIINMGSADNTDTYTGDGASNLLVYTAAIT